MGSIRRERAGAIAGMKMMFQLPYRKGRDINYNRLEQWVVFMWECRYELQQLVLAEA